MFLESIQGNVYMDYLIFFNDPNVPDLYNMKNWKCTLSLFLFLKASIFALWQNNNQFHSKSRSNRMQGFNQHSSISVLLTLTDFTECFLASTTRFLKSTEFVLCIVNVFYSSYLLTILYNMTNLLSSSFQNRCLNCHFHMRILLSEFESQNNPTLIWYPAIISYDYQFSSFK